MKKAKANFKPDTWGVIYKLRDILNKKSYYPTLGHFYRDIELLKFPYLANCKHGDYYYSSHGRNVYSQLQYDTIVDYCVAQGWISILPKTRRSYHVFSNGTSGDSRRERQPHENAAIQIARNSTYGAKPVAADMIMNIELDPKLKWSVRVENGKTYLTAK